MANQTLTPAEIGILSVCIDDCKRDGLGDDDTVERLVILCQIEDICPTHAYPLFRQSLK